MKDRDRERKVLSKSSPRSFLSALYSLGHCEVIFKEQLEEATGY